jgi:hypothetical protein
MVLRIEGRIGETLEVDSSAHLAGGELFCILETCGGGATIRGTS